MVLSEAKCNSLCFDTLVYLYDTNIDKIEKKIQDSESHNINVDVYHAFSRKLKKNFVLCYLLLFVIAVF